METNKALKISAKITAIKELTKSCLGDMKSETDSNIHKDLISILSTTYSLETIFETRYFVQAIESLQTKVKDLEDFIEESKTKVTKDELIKLLHNVPRVSTARKRKNF